MEGCGSWFKPLPPDCYPYWQILYGSGLWIADAESPQGWCVSVGQSVDEKTTPKQIYVQAPSNYDSIPLSISPSTIGEFYQLFYLPSPEAAGAIYSFVLRKDKPGCEVLIGEISSDCTVTVEGPQRNPLMDHIAIVSAIEKDKLQDHTFMERTLIPLLGINPGGPFAHQFPQHLHKYFGGLRLWQLPEQLAPYLIRLSRLNIRSYLEIGIQFGGTFALTIEYLSRFMLIERALGVDAFVWDKDSWQWYTRPGIQWCACNSQSPAFRELLSSQQFDLVLIDGDHSSMGVRHDYECIREMVQPKWIAFHDINNLETIGVVELWREIKVAHPGAWQEYINGFEGAESYFGLGLLDLTVQP